MKVPRPDQRGGTNEELDDALGFMEFAMRDARMSPKATKAFQKIEGFLLELKFWRMLEEADHVESD